MANETPKAQAPGGKAAVYLPTRLRSRRGDRSTLDRPRSPASHLVARICQVSEIRRWTFPKKEQEFRLFSSSLFEYHLNVFEN
jgi:hypothetical protein